MKLARIGPAGQESPVVVDEDGGLRDLRGVVDDISSRSLADGRLERLRGIDVASLPILPADGVRYGPPVGDVGKIICVGLNYTDHAAEVGLPVPEEPTIFMKGCRPTGPNDEVRLPRDAAKGDWEVELGIVIGKSGMYVDEADADGHIAGLCLFNDLTERSYQWSAAGSGPRARASPASRRWAPGW